MAINDMKQYVILLLLFWAVTSNCFAKEFKIVSNKYGLCKLNLISIINISPDLEGDSNDYLHLFFEGKEIPIYYHSVNNGGLIHSNDFIIFANHPHDTLDTYSTENVFFLVYDNTKHGTRMQQLAFANNATMDIKTTKEVYKYEEDKDYYLWDNLHYQPAKFEKWYWKKLIDYPRGLETDAKLSHQFYLQPDTNSFVNIKVFFSTLVTNKPSDLNTIKRKLNLIVNLDTVNSHVFNNIADNEYFETTISSDDLLVGVNELSILNATVDNLRSDIGIDKIEVSGNFGLCYSNAYPYYNIDTLTANSRLSISGFMDSTIIVYDTLSKQINYIKGASKTAVSVSTKMSSPFTSIKINDSSYVSTAQGIHIVALQPADVHLTTNVFPNYYQAVARYIDNLPIGSVVCIAINIDEIGAFKNYLLNLGFTAISRYEPATGAVYVCNFIKGEAGGAEDLQYGLSKIHNEFNDTYNRKFSGEFLLNKGKDYVLLMSDSTNTKNVSNNVFPVIRELDLLDVKNEAEAIFIYHEAFAKQSKEYATYRKSQGIKVVTVNIDDIYREFSFGRKSAVAIKDFLYFAKHNWNSGSDVTLKYCLLIGDASNDPRNINGTAVDFIPTFGWPESDYWFGSFANNDVPDMNKDIFIGRIPAASVAQLDNYITKVKVYEQAPIQPWHKTFLFLSGGNTQSERNSIKQIAMLNASLLSNSIICIDTNIISKKDTIEDPIGISDIYKNDILQAVNNGAMLTVFNGHGSTSGFDMSGWPASTLNNNNKFGFLTTLSCNTGEFANSWLQTCINEEYMLAYSDKGFVAAMGSTTTTSINSNDELMNNISLCLAKTNYRRLGDVLHYAKSKINYNMPDDYTYVMRDNFNLLGDPLIAFKVATKPEFHINDISVVSENNIATITEANQIAKVKFNIFNGGHKYESTSQVKLIHNHYGIATNYEQTIDAFCNSIAMEFIIPIDSQPGQHKITIELEDGTAITHNFNVLKNSLYPIVPLNNWCMPNPLHFRFIRNISQVANSDYNINLYKVNRTDTNLFYTSTPNEINITELYVDWKPDIVLPIESDIGYIVKVVEQYSNGVNDSIQIPFNLLTDNLGKDKVKWELKTYTELSTLALTDLMLNVGNINYISIMPNKSSGMAILSLIGPAKKWDTLLLNGEHLEDIKIEIFGYASENDMYNNVATNPIKEIAGDYKIAISDLAEPYLQFKILFNNPQSRLYSIGSTFSPTPEVAIVPSKTILPNDTCLRGDTAQYKFVVQNLSLHSNIDDLVFNINSIKQQYGQLSSNAEIELTFPIETEYLNYNNITNVVLFNSDIYSFNNDIIDTFDVIDDTVVPNLQVLFDGYEVPNNNGQIRNRPVVDVILNDNSNLMVIDDAITVRLNGSVILDSSNTNEWQWKIMPKGRPVKATLHFVLDSLPDTENLFFFTGIDAAGNKITETYRLKIAVNNDIVKHYCFPNPSSMSDDTRIEYELMRTTKDAFVKIDIFDSFGKQVQTLSSAFDFSKNNSIAWNKLNYAQEKVAPGVYFYRLQILGNDWIRDVYGNICIVK